MRQRNLLIFGGAIVILIIIAVFAHGGRQPGMPVDTIVVKRGPFAVKLAENGIVMSPHSQTIPTLVSGNLESLAVHEGEHVFGGQLLATVYNPALAYAAAGSQADYSSSVSDVGTARVNEQNARVQYEAAVATAKSSLDLAQRIYDEDVALFHNQAIPRNQLDTDGAKLEQALVTYRQAVQQLRLGAVSGYGMDSVQTARANARKASILNAQNQQQLGFTHVVAPFGGTILSIASDPSDPLRPIRVGEPVTQGEALFTIAGSGNDIVRAEVDEQDIIGVRLGQRVLVTGEDFPGHTIAGRVTLISPIATKSTDTTSTAKQVLTTIALDTSPYFLKDGMNVDVDILTTDLSDVISVPNAAVSTDTTGSYVYVVQAGVARKRRVRIGAVGDTATLVLSGLGPGDRVVSSHYVGLADGAHVEPTSSPSPLPIASGAFSTGN
ncbi:MAG: efflux RND transporter periplasmic adaptor subunit [Candidatus Tyrphobacter sp.]